MRISVRLSWLPVLGVAVAPLSCSFPTDKSSEVFVVVVPSDSLAAHGILDRGGRDVTGFNPGFAQMTARAVPFGRSLDGAATVRVADRFIIDSIRPLSLHY